MAKAAVDKLTADLTVQLAEYDVTSISMYPGLVRTEGVMENKQFFDMSNSESMQFQGRAVTHLFADRDRLRRSGKVFTSAQLALDYGFTDVDGYQPRPLTLEAV